MKPKLHELLAVEGTREAETTALIKETANTFTKKGDHFLGKHTSYKAFAEDAIEEDDTYKNVVTTVHDKLTYMFDSVINTLNVQISKDLTNQEATAPIIIDGKAITDPLPAVTLLSLEGKIKTWISVLQKIPTLPPARTWELDESQGSNIYKDANPESRFRTKKTIQHKVLVEATQHHRAEIEKWTEDVNVGKITDITWCSMLPTQEKSMILRKAQNLLEAVKQARQVANCQEVVETEAAASIVKYLLD